MKKLLTDSKVCTGCRSCEAICSVVHSGDESNPMKSRIRVDDDAFHGIFNPIVCRQCNNPKCITACREDAIHLDAVLGNPLIDSVKCNACLACKEACPFNAIFLDNEEGKPIVCDLCGGDPMCVKFCRNYPDKTHSALGYMEPREWSKKIHQ